VLLVGDADGQRVFAVLVEHCCENLELGAHILGGDRKRIEDAIEEVLLGRASSQDALDRAAEEITTAIDRYNKSTG